MGKIYTTDFIADHSESTGVANQVLISTTSGVAWVDGAGSEIIGGPYVTIGTDQTVTGIKSFSGKIGADGGIDGLTLTNGGISGSNYDITGVNSITINDPGEGIIFTGTATMFLNAVDDATDSILKLTNATQLNLNSTARITSLVNPIDAQDAATKNYVDSEIGNIPAGLAFEGNWNASTDDPTLSGTTPDNGKFWIVTVAGATDLSGITDWKIGDWAIYVDNGAGTDAWQKVDNSSTLSGLGSAGKVALWSSTSNVSFNSNLLYDGTYLTTPRVRVGDGTDGYFYSDTAGRTAFRSGEFYIQNSVPNYYNYATNIHLGATTGDNVLFRGSTITGTSWGITPTGVVTAGGGFLVPYATATKKPMINLAGATNYGLWHTEGSDDIFSFDFGGTSKQQFFQSGNATFVGDITAPTFLGDLNGTINTATTGVTQTAGNNSTLIATTAYADAAASAVDPSGVYLPLAGGTMTGNVIFPGEEANSFKIAFTGASASSGISTVDQSGAGLYIGANSRVNTSGSVVFHDTLLPSSGIYFDGWQGDDMEFYTGSSGNPTKRLTIEAGGDAIFTGNVGIGLADPDSRLDINAGVTNITAGPAVRISKGASPIGLIRYDTLVVEANDVATIRIGESDGTVSTIMSGDNNLRINSTDPIKFYTAGTTTGEGHAGQGGTFAMIIDNSQNVGIGGTGPGEKLEITGNSITRSKTRGLGTNYATSEGWVASSGVSSAAGFFGGNFGSNGGNLENKIEYDIGPFGSRELVWMSVPETGNNDDGGWNKSMDGFNNSANNGFMSVIYVRRDSGTAAGNFYHGCSGSSTLNLSGSVNTNPYFSAAAISILPADVWCVAIGIIHAANDTTTTLSALGGIYRLDTGQKIQSSTTFRQKTSNATQIQRVYHYYSTSPTAQLDFANPGFYILDGSEPTLSKLLGKAAGEGIFLPLANPTFTGTLTGPAATITTVTGNLLGNATTASSAAQVTITYNNDSNSTYQMLWGSGNGVYGTGGVYLNPSSNTVTATTFSGALSGNATTATTATTSNLIKVNDYAGATNMRILGSHQTGGSDNVYSNASMYLNCDTGIINATGFNGALTGNATTATTASSVSHSYSRTDTASYPVVWMTASSTSQAYSCAAVTITSSAGRINATTFNGALTGNVTGNASGVSETGYGSDNFTFWQTSGAFAGYSGWANYFIGNHGNGSTYYNTVHIMPFWGAPKYSRLTGGVQSAVYDYWTSENHTPSNYLPLAGGAMTGNIQMNSQIFATAGNYGRGVFGLYNATKYQHVWSMGTAYKLADDGASTGTGGNLYGLAWSYNPGHGGAGNNAQSKAGLNHQLLLMQNGTTSFAAGVGMWTSGNATIEGTMIANQISLKSGGNEYLHVSSYSNNSYIYGYASGSTIHFGQPATWAQNIQVSGDAFISGRLAVLTSTIVGSAINVEVPITNSGVGSDFRISTGSGYGMRNLSVEIPGYGSGIKIYSPSSSSVDNNAMTFVNNGSTVGGINLNTSSTSFSTTSDYRLKENREDILGAIERVKELKPIKFNWIKEPGEAKVDGFYAHELAEVVPEAVTGEKDALDWEGNPAYQSIDQAKIVPLLTAALQQAIDKIEALELRINKLEKQ